MPKKHPNHNPREKRLECENVYFAEVHFPVPVVPLLIVQFSGGLSLLVENRDAVELAAEFIISFHSFEKGGRR